MGVINLNETYFFRDVKDLKSLEIKTNKKIINNQIKNKYDIIKAIKLTEKEFQEFSSNFRHNYKFLYDYIEQMGIDKNGIWRCVQVEGKEKKILVQNNGYSYPRFTGLFL